MAVKDIIVVDVLGLILVCFITVAKVSDVTAAKTYVGEFDGVKYHNPRIQAVVADSGYRGLEKEVKSRKIIISEKGL